MTNLALSVFFVLNALLLARTIKSRQMHAFNIACAATAIFLLYYLD